MQVYKYIIKQKAIETNTCFCTSQSVPELILRKLKPTVPQCTIWLRISFCIYESGVEKLLHNAIFNVNYFLTLMLCNSMLRKNYFILEIRKQFWVSYKPIWNKNYSWKFSVHPQCRISQNSVEEFTSWKHASWRPGTNSPLLAAFTVSVTVHKRSWNNITQNQRNDKEEIKISPQYKETCIKLHFRR
jgi:hypothetical protein